MIVMELFRTTLNCVRHACFSEAPKVKRSEGHEVRVYVGDPLDICVSISGAPTPTVSWKKDDQDLAENPHVNIYCLRLTDSR